MDIAAKVRECLNSAPLVASYRNALITALSLPGNILSDEPDTRWARLVITCCITAGGSRRQSVSAAAAAEMFMVALDLLDDEEDREDNSLRVEIGAARTLNVSTGLLLVAQHTLLSVGGDGSAARILLDASIRACGGQHDDLSGQPQNATFEQAVSVTARKSASLVAGVCRLGAYCANAEEHQQRLYERYGRASHIRVVCQRCLRTRAGSSNQQREFGSYDT